ncbi:hypothetical protein F5B20DRAFT_247626 [Whalleya microplaca]|nr:hypothetical protein F5B20DRAFT_247626 [Whalleya microplaca]
MAIDASPRSVADATRFTSNTPHAKAKASPANPSAISSSSSSPVSPSSPTARTATSPSSSPNSPRSAAATAAPQRRTPAAAAPGAPGPRPSQTETLDERVRRLRAAHLAARKHEVSRFDRVVGAGRRYFDAAHKFTVMGLIGFSGLALLVTGYATVDMMLYNRKRRGEFFALQQQLRADSLDAARLAYLTGDATPEQVALVDEATARAAQSGEGLPPLLSSPRPALREPSHPTNPNANPDTADSVGRSAWPGEALTEANLDGASEASTQKKKGGLRAWLFGGLKEEEPPQVSQSQSQPQQSLSFAAEEAAASNRSGEQGALKDKAKAAFESERENQRRGGPLDQVGLSEGESGGSGGSNGGEGKKGWW